MKKSIIASSVVSAGLIIATTLPAFALTNSTLTMTGSAGASSASKVMCVATAVTSREQSLEAAFNTLTTAQNAAYTARGTSLAQAYAQTGGNGAIQKAVKAAWSTFNSSMKSARSTWKTSQSSAWSTFKTAAKACKAPAAVSDTENSGSESSGN
jgi:hypothetical protein